MEEEKIQKKISISSLKEDFDKNKTSSLPKNISWEQEKSTIEEQNKNSLQTETTNEIKEEVKEWEDNKFSEQESWWQNSEKQEDEELFTNYTPIFEKRRLSFTEKVENLKKKAKTNYVYILIIIFIWGIFSWAIIYITPQYHSLDNYKASVINIFHKENKNKDEGKDDIPYEVPINNTPLEQPEDAKASIENEMTWTSSTISSTWQIQEEKINASKEDVTKEKIKNHFKNHQ